MWKIDATCSNWKHAKCSCLNKLHHAEEKIRWLRKLGDLPYYTMLFYSWHPFNSSPRKNVNNFQIHDYLQVIHLMWFWCLILNWHVVDLVKEMVANCHVYIFERPSSYFCKLCYCSDHAMLGLIDFFISKLEMFQLFF